MLRQIINDGDIYRIREPADGQTDGQFTHLPSFLPSFDFFTAHFEELLITKRSASVTAV
jgi:hypothetical protein